MWNISVTEGFGIVVSFLDFEVAHSNCELAEFPDSKPLVAFFIACVIFSSRNVPKTTMIKIQLKPL